MDHTLNCIPCGYLSMLDDNIIEAANQTLLTLLEYEQSMLYGQSIDFILSNSSRLLFRIYFTPLLLLNNKVDEMFLTLKSRSGKEIPVLLNGVRQEFEGSVHHECVMFPIHRQMDYEQQINRAETAANKARHELKHIQAVLENKQQALLELEAQIKDYERQMREKS